jgi:hypothetical protein
MLYTNNNIIWLNQTQKGTWFVFARKIYAISSTVSAALRI